MDRDERDAGSLTMTLAADAETRAQFPFDFTAHHRVMIVPGGVQLELAIVAGDRDVPVSPGWHPYFTIERTDKARSPSAPRHDQRRSRVRLRLRRARRRRSRSYHGIALEASPDLRHLQMWSQPGKPFVCIEPFFGPAGTINTDQRGWVRANEARSFWMRIRCRP